MYHASYHPLAGAELDYVLKDLTEEQKAIAKPQIEAATAAQTRRYRITIVPPESPQKPDSGIYFDIDNGLVSGSSNQ